jgi:hypothetical protein
MGVGVVLVSGSWYLGWEAFIDSGGPSCYV